MTRTNPEMGYRRFTRGGGCSFGDRSDISVLLKTKDLAVGPCATVCGNWGERGVQLMLTGKCGRNRQLRRRVNTNCPLCSNIATVLADLAQEQQIFYLRAVLTVMKQILDCKIRRFSAAKRGSSCVSHTAKRGLFSFFWNFGRAADVFQNPT